MENSSLKTFLAAPEETEEPWPKKFKMDSNQMIFEKEQRQLFEIHNEDKKSANKFLYFPKTWNFCQHNLELQEKSSADLKNSVRQHANFKMYMNANLQSRLLENIPYVRKWPPNSSTSIWNASCKFKKNNSDIIKFESLDSYAKETMIANISKGNEWPIKGIVFYIILAEKFIARIESLFGNMPEFQNNENGPSCCPVYKMLWSEEQYPISKPIRRNESSDEKVLKFRLPVKNFMNKKKSDSGSLIYDYKNVLHKNSDILSWKKQKRFSGKKNFRRNKVFQHMCTSYSRHRGNLNPKLAKVIAFDLFLQSKDICHYSTVTGNGIPELNHISQINHQQTEKSNEEDTKKCLLCPTDIVDIDIFSIVCYGKEQTSQMICFNNQILPDKKFSVILWERSLYIPETIYNLADNFRLLNCLISIPIMCEKSNVKHFKLELVTIEQFIQKKNRKACNQTNDCSKKIKYSYFILREYNKCKNRRFKNSINCTSSNKYVPKYIEISRKETMNKTQYGNHKCGQNNPCDFVGRKSHFDTYTKICLSSYSEEIEYVSLLGNVIIPNEKYSKGVLAAPEETEEPWPKRFKMDSNQMILEKEQRHLFEIHNEDKKSANKFLCFPKTLWNFNFIFADKRLTSNCFETLTYICVPFKLCINYSSLLKQENKNKNSQYFKDSRWLKQEISCKLFPISRRLFNNPFDVNQYFTSDTFHHLCLNQNIAISVEAKQSKTSLCGKRTKQSFFEFENLKNVLQYQYQTTWISEVSKKPKVKTTENVNFLDGKNILFRATVLSELLSVNQTAEDVNKTKHAIAEQSYINKINQSQSLCEIYFKEECGKSVNSVDELTVASCSTKQSFKDSREGHFSSETNRRDQFDLVLEELCMFNKIGKENENSLSQEEINILEKESHVLNCTNNISDEINRNINQNSVTSTTGIVMNCVSGTKQNRYKKSLFQQSVPSGKQEIPHNHCSSISDEELFCSTSEEHVHCKQTSWKSAFISQTLMKEGSYSLTTGRENCFLNGIIRVQPLKTCCGPVRVGLSRKAKLKQLHPYLK